MVCDGSYIGPHSSKPFANPVISRAYISHGALCKNNVQNPNINNRRLRLRGGSDMIMFNHTYSLGWLTVDRGPDLIQASCNILGHRYRVGGIKALRSPS